MMARCRIVAFAIMLCRIAGLRDEQDVEELSSTNSSSASWCHRIAGSCDSSSWSLRSKCSVGSCRHNDCICPLRECYRPYRRGVPSSCVAQDKLCRPGLYCLECPAGKYNSETTSTSIDACLECPAGKKSTKGATTCSKCGTSSYQSQAGQSECKKCPYWGSTKKRGSTSIKKCDSFVAGITDQNEDVSERDDGHNTTGAAQVVMEALEEPDDPNCNSDGIPELKLSLAKDCSSGYTEDGGDCVPQCPAGSWCLQCPRGRFNDKPDRVSKEACAKCPKGRYSDQIGASECKQCAAGRHGITTCAKAADDCGECPKGTYAGQRMRGVPVCEMCSEGRFSSAPGQNTCEDCAPGKLSVSLGATACDDCKSGTGSQLNPRDTECKKCNIGFFWAPGEHEEQGTCAQCDYGKYSDTEGSMPCKMCNAGKTTKHMSSNSSSDCERQDTVTVYWRDLYFEEQEKHRF